MNTVAERPLGANPHQNNGHWMSDRTGCLTASRIAKAIKRLRDGSYSKESDDMAKEILAERLSGIAMTHYVSPEMEHGTETEPEAREVYEAHTGNLVQLVGFIKHPSIQWCGASPDGLVDDDGLIEIKCPKTATHIGYKAMREAPLEYRPQMLLQLACTRRSWVDFVSYDNRVKDPKHRLHVVRFEPDRFEIEKIEEEAAEFLRRIDNLFDQLNGG